MAQYLILGMYGYPSASDRKPLTVLSPHSCLLREGTDTQAKKPQLSTSARRIICELNMPVRAWIATLACMIVTSWKVAGYQPCCELQGVAASKDSRAWFCDDATCQGWGMNVSLVPRAIPHDRGGALPILPSWAA